MDVEIWSDVVCPWCYIGKRRFEAALAGFEHRDQVRVSARSFELDPSAPRSLAVDGLTHIAEKYGVSVEQARAMQQNVVDAAAAEGLELRFDIARRGNTFDAHRLLHLAGERGLQWELKERLMRGYFTEGVPIGEPAALAPLATPSAPRFVIRRRKRSRTAARRRPVRRRACPSSEMDALVKGAGS